MRTWIRASLLGMVAVCTAACGMRSSAFGGGATYAATATVRVLPPETVTDGTLGQSYDQWLATELVLMKMPEFIEKAVKEANLRQLPDFQGRSEDQIARDVVGHIEFQRREGTNLLDITVTGPNARVLAPYTNALARTFQTRVKPMDKWKRDQRKAQLEEKRDTCDTMIRLLSIDKMSCLKGCGLTKTTLQDACDTGPRRRAEYTMQIDALTRRLAEAEAQNATPEVKKALVATRDSCTAELKRLQVEAESLAEVKNVLDQKDHEIARHLESKAVVTRDLEDMQSSERIEHDTVYVVSVATEPDRPR